LKVIIYVQDGWAMLTTFFPLTTIRESQQSARCQKLSKRVVKTIKVDKKTISEVMRMLGKKGGPARIAKLTAKERSALARKAAKARWKAEKQKPA
jgi:hypothetical protein